MRQVAGQGAQVAFGGQDFGQSRHLAGLDRARGACPVRPRAGRRWPVRPLPVPANRCSRPACRRASAARPPFAAGVSAAPSARRCRVPAAARPRRDGAGWCRWRRRAHRPARRRIDSRFAIRSHPPRPSAASQPEPRKIVAQPRHAIGRTVDRGDPARRPAPAARSCRPAPRTDPRLLCPRRRRTTAPATPRRRPAPTIVLRQSPAAWSPSPAAACARFRSAASRRAAASPTARRRILRSDRATAHG